MELGAAFTIILLMATLVVLSAQWLRADLTALLVMLLLIVSGILSPTEAFSAFGQPVILIVASIFVIGAALFDTGVATLIANQILRFGSRGETALLVVIILTTAIMTAFLDGLLTVALLLPAVLRVARQANLAPSRLLLPLATTATIGNPLTLIGTTSNLVVSDILGTSGYTRLGLFSLTPYALVSVGLVLLTPIAISLAVAQGAPPEPFAIATAFAVLAGYVTPLTDGDNLLVREPGQYSMRDYVSNGLPIFVLQTIALMSMLAFFYGLK